MTQEMPFVWGQAGSGEQAKPAGKAASPERPEDETLFGAGEFSPSAIPWDCRPSLPFALTAKPFGGENVAGKDRPPQLLQGDSGQRGLPSPASASPVSWLARMRWEIGSPA